MKKLSRVLVIQVLRVLWIARARKKIDKRVSSVFTVGYKKDKNINMSFKDGGQSGKREMEKRKKAGAGAKWKKDKNNTTKVFKRYCYFSLLKPNTTSPSLSLLLSLYFYYSGHYPRRLWLRKIYDFHHTQAAVNRQL